MKTERGLVLVNTGPGKGKTTAALGAALRAAGQGFRVAVLQFIKGPGRTGEAAALASVPGVKIRQLGLGMLRGKKDLAADQAQARRAWAECQATVASGTYDLVILDEVCLALHYGFLEAAEVVGLIKDKPPQVHLILTGRHCPDEVLEAADTVTWMEVRKHHLLAGFPGRAGIEY